VPSPPDYSALTSVPVRGLHLTLQSTDGSLLAQEPRYLDTTVDVQEETDDDGEQAEEHRH
jgi:hypothetical protein